LKYSFRMKRVLWSLVFGGVVTGIIWICTLALDRRGQDRLFPDCLLRPGLYISIFMPDSHFDEGTVEGTNAGQPGPVSSFVFIAANIVIYGGVIYLFLSLATLLLNQFRTGVNTHTQ
jgi:hypothetical protein